MCVGCPGPRPPAPALEQPNSNHAGPGPGEVSAFPRLTAKQPCPERNPLGLGEEIIFLHPKRIVRATEGQPGGEGPPHKRWGQAISTEPRPWYEYRRPSLRPQSTPPSPSRRLNFSVLLVYINAFRGTAHHGYDYYLNTSFTALISSARYFLKNYPRGPKFSKSGLESFLLRI